MKKIAISVLLLILSNICGASPTLLKFILIGEESYQKYILKSEDPTLVDNNFMVCPQTMNQTIFLDSVYKKIESYPRNMLPIIISTFPNYEAINTAIKDTIRYPKRNVLNIVISYIGNGPIFPVGYNTNITIDSGMVLVGGGNESCDWTWGNKLQFINPVDIQYVTGSGIGVTQYVIDSIYSQSYPNRVYSPILASQAVWGTPIWLRITTDSGVYINRYAIGNQNGGGTYVTTAQINFAGVFLSGTAVVNWRSGAVVYIASVLKKIMTARNCSFSEALICAKATGSNSGIWRSNNGFGRINVQLAINYQLP